MTTKENCRYLFAPKISLVLVLCGILGVMIYVFFMFIKPSESSEALRNVEIYRIKMIDTVVSINQGENSEAINLFLSDINSRFDLTDKRLDRLQGNLTETFNTYRQESNNYINKVNGFISLWLGVLALIGIFTPFMINRHFETKIRDYEKKLKEAEERVKEMEVKTSEMEHEVRKKGMVEGIVAMRVFDGVLMIDKMDPERLKEIFMSMKLLHEKIDTCYKKIINSNEILNVDREYVIYSIGVFRVAYRRLYHIVQDRQGLELFDKLLKNFNEIIKANEDGNDKKLRGNLNSLLIKHKKCLNYIRTQCTLKKYSV